MIVRTAVPLLLLGALACPAAETGDAPAAAWSSTLTMVLKERPRTFVVRDGTPWLAMVADDLADPAFLDGKDVMLAAKYERGDQERAWFYGFPGLAARGRADLWSTRIEGDNLFVFGRTRRVGNAVELVTTAVVVGESDAQTVAKQLEGIPEGDFDRRLTVAQWVREHGATQGNRDWWTAAADTIVAQAVQAAVAAAAPRKDAALVARAVGWALDDIRDPGLAARAASQPWLFDAGGPVADAIAQRLRGLRFDYYKGQWRTRLEALQMQFDDRFAAIAWRDAEAYFKLGRWAEANADELPRARELAHRCYQAGLRADTAHAGIRRALGLGPVTAAGAAGRKTLEGAFTDECGAAIDGPEGWNRSEPIEGEATWIDPASETAYVSVRITQGDAVAAGFDAEWESALKPLRARAGFEALDEQPLAFPAGEAKRLRFRYREGRYTRFSEVILAWAGEQRIAALIGSSFTEEEQEAAGKALLTTFAKLVIPAEVKGADAKEAKKEPAKDAKDPMDGKDAGTQATPAEGTEPEPGKPVLP